MFYVATCSQQITRVTHPAFAVHVHKELFVRSFRTLQCRWITKISKSDVSYVHLPKLQT